MNCTDSTEHLNWDTNEFIDIWQNDEGLYALALQVIGRQRFDAKNFRWFVERDFEFFVAHPELNADEIDWDRVVEFFNDDYEGGCG